MKFIFVETVDEVLQAALEPDAHGKHQAKTKEKDGKRSKSGK
jgi:hypothetical protein